MIKNHEVQPIDTIQRIENNGVERTLIAHINSPESHDKMNWLIKCDGMIKVEGKDLYKFQIGQTDETLESENIIREVAVSKDGQVYGFRSVMRHYGEIPDDIIPVEENVLDDELVHDYASTKKTSGWNSSSCAGKYKRFNFKTIAVPQLFRTAQAEYLQWVPSFLVRDNRQEFRLRTN